MENKLFSTPLPAETETYKPVGHQFLVDQLLDRIGKSKHIQLREKYYRGNGKGTQMVVSFVLEGAIMPEYPQHRLMITLQNSYDKTMAIRMGAGIMDIQTGGKFLATVEDFYRKHTGNCKSDYDDLISRIGKKLSAVAQDFVDMRRGMAAKLLTREDVSGMFARLFFDDELLTGQQLRIAAEQYRDAVKSTMPLTAWMAYDMAAQALTIDHPVTTINSHLRLHEFMRDEFGMMPVMTKQEPQPAEIAA
jgi:hypothetical protein